MFGPNYDNETENLHFNMKIQLICLYNVIS